MTDNFQWTDELVSEFIGTIRGFERENMTPLIIEQFKASKSKKDYEILSFKGNRDELVKWKGEDNHGGYNYKQWVDSCLSFDYKIHSVKRLSDGEVFTVGDKVKYKGEKCGYDFFIIDNFFVNDYDKILARSKNSIIEYLHEIVKIKQPLFKTEDGVDIFEGDPYFKLWRNYDWTYTKYYSSKGGEYSNNYAIDCFSSEEVIKDYILHNKLVLCVNDVLDRYLVDSNYEEVIINLAKEKLNQ